MKPPAQRRHESMRRWAESFVVVEDEPPSGPRRERLVAWTAVAVERAAVMAKNRRRRSAVFVVLAVFVMTLFGLAAARPNEVRSEETTAASARSQDQARVDIGAVHVRVPRSTEGQTFAIRTPRGEVTVRTYPSGIAPENSAKIDVRP